MKVIPEHIFKELVLSGVNEFMYLSYDHDAAMTHAIKMGAKPNGGGSKMGARADGTGGWHYLPPQFTNKFPLWRKGKIREMQFNPDGSIKKILVSKHFPYKKPFHPSQFGVDVKPIIFESDDKYNLIKNGLAEKNNQL